MALTTCRFDDRTALVLAYCSFLTKIFLDDYLDFQTIIFISLCNLREVESLLLLFLAYILC